MELPAFRYHPNALTDGTVAPSDEVCSACAQARGYITSSILYTADPAGDGPFCPWCIADGTAATRYDGTFNEVELGASPEATDEVARRTPNFETWQDWEWPVHCGDVMAYLGDPDLDVLRRYPDAHEALREEVRAYDWGDDEEHLYGLALYLFRCPACGMHRAKWDMD